MDDKKKKKLDAERVALTQPYEVRHLKKTANQLITKLETTKSYIYFDNGKVHKITIIKICKALLKALNKL